MESGLRPKALLCFDFDGTLVDKEREPAFDPRLGDYLNDLRQRGAAWVINTGRSLMHVLEGIVHFRIPVAPDFIIAREHEIFVRNAAGRWIDCGEWNSHCRRKHDAFFRHHRRFFKEIRAFVEAAERAAWIEDPIDAAGLVATSEAAMVEIVAFIDERRSLYPELGYQRNSIYLRFTHRDFDKGSALRELTRQLGVGPQFVFAAGDNHNDLSMLRSELAHGLCCPSNAIWEVKNQVRREGGLIANSPGSSGMVEAMQHYFYNGQADGR